MSDESKVSKAQQKAVAKYMKNNYDEIKVRVEKGKREIIKAAAEQAGESLNGYIKKAVDQRMERDNAQLALIVTRLFLLGMNNGYRSFLVSQLLYSILADVFKEWYTDGNGGLEDLRIKEMTPEQINQLMAEIEEYLQKLQVHSNTDITSLETFEDYESQYDNLKTLYQKLKKYL